ncbi:MULTISPECIES: hypothetical protein [unclassified Sphingopyxis]|uniref:hypothetical protein n=1 Tax=unclassified Sphingopyxis TaxID=2614943 RepID=UPI000AD7E372|nr:MULTISPECIES: hypothetical protein [unclassified Sphingopyxis]
MFKKQSSIFRSRPRELSAEEMKKLAGAGPFEEPKFGSKAPYDMDYATRTFN